MAALDGFDRMKRALVAIVDARLRARGVDYLALYPARVAAQNDDGTLELVPDDPRFKGLSRVPLRLGLPGVKVRVKPDSRVLVGFEAGDPSRPYASVWDAATVESIEVTAKTKVVVDAPKVVVDAAAVELGGEGGRPIAAVGDFARLGGALPIVGEAIFIVPGSPPGTPMATGSPFQVFLTFRKPVMLPIVSGSKRGKIKS